MMTLNRYRKEYHYIIGERGMYPHMIYVAKRLRILAEYKSFFPYGGLPTWAIYRAKEGRRVNKMSAR